MTKLRIGLYNLEPKIINTALMQVSTYHKSKGNIVELYNPFHKYDNIYAFSIFDFTDKSYITKDMICGGSGFDITSKLPKEIEDCDYDWSLYPKCNYSIVWFSRGCIRNCPFCLVRKKEGYIHSTKPKNLNPNGTHIKVTDNNFFANPEWKEAIEKIKEWNQPIDFQCGLDIRLFNKEQGKNLKSIKIYKRIKIAWDNPKEDLVPKIKELLKYFKPYRIMCYVLIGYSSSIEEDMMRINELIKLKIDPYVMPYNKKDSYQKNLSRWCNRVWIRKKCSFEEYKKKTKIFNNKDLSEFFR